MTWEWWRKLSHDGRVQLVAAIALAAIAILVAVALKDNSDDPEPRQVPTGSATPTATGPSTSPIITTTSVARSTTRSTSAAPPPGVQSFDITIEEMSGQKVGPNLFQLTPGGARLGIQWDWVGLRADGTENNGNDCQIVVNVSGPDTFPTYRTDECSKSSGSMSADNAEEFTVPGNYTVAITDETTGATGTANFRVLG